MLYTCPSATQWTASVHALHMPKPNVTRVQSAMQWTASVHTLHMPKPVMWNVFSSVYVESRSIIWRSKTTFCVVVHISRTSYKNRKTSDCNVNHMILDFANVWRHRASRRRVTLFFCEDRLSLIPNIVPGRCVSKRAFCVFLSPKKVFKMQKGTTYCKEGPQNKAIKQKLPKH